MCLWSCKGLMLRSATLPLTRGRDISRGGFWSRLACLGCIFQHVLLSSVCNAPAACARGTIVSMTTPDVLFNTSTQLHVFSCWHCIYIDISCVIWSDAGYHSKHIFTILYLMHPLAWAYWIWKCVETLHVFTSVCHQVLTLECVRLCAFMYVIPLGQEIWPIKPGHKHCLLIGWGYLQLLDPGSPSQL